MVLSLIWLAFFLIDRGYAFGFNIVLVIVISLFILSGELFCQLVDVIKEAIKIITSMFFILLIWSVIISVGNYIGFDMQDYSKLIKNYVVGTFAEGLVIFSLVIVVIIAIYGIRWFLSKTFSKFISKYRFIEAVFYGRENEGDSDV